MRRRLGAAPVFDSGIVLGLCGLLAAASAWLLVARWRHPATLDDFSVFWAAGRLALNGHAAAAYDWVSIRQLQPFATSVTRYVYPPIFFLVLAPLALLPFGKAAAVWLAGNLVAYLAGMRAILRGAAALAAMLAAPMVLFNLSEGQNGLLAAGLLGGALALLDARPVASGVLIGLLAYKPHLGILLPFFLAATGRWRVFVTAAMTIAVLIAVAAMWFGWDAFVAFAEAIPRAAGGYLQQGRLRAPEWGVLQSPYGIFAALGIGKTAAWAGHGVIGVLAAAAALRIATGGAPAAIKAAAVATAAMLVTPYSELNDLAVLMVPWAFLLRDGLSRGFARWERPALWALYLLPIGYFWGRVSGVLPWEGLGPLMCLVLVVLIGHRLRRGAAAATGAARADDVAGQPQAP